MKIVLIDSCAAILSVLSVFLSIICFLDLNNSNYYYIHQLARNWSFNPIMEIKENSDFNGCDTLITEPWPGTIEGCNCRYQLFGSGFKGRSCDNDENFCYSISSISPKKYEYWEGKKLCTQRSSLSYFDLTIIAQKGYCPNSYRNCGYIDSFNNMLCIKNEESCPITGIKIINTNNQKVPSNWTSISLTEEKTLIFFKDEKDLNQTSLNLKSYYKTSSNNTLNNTLVQKKNRLKKGFDDYFFKIIELEKQDLLQIPEIKKNTKMKDITNSGNNASTLSDNTSNQYNRILNQFRVEEDVPCKNSLYFNSKHSTYLLDSTRDKVGCPNFYGDTLEDSYEKIDSTSNLELLRFNGILGMLKVLPEYSSDNWDYPINLYAKNYAGVDSRCFKELSYVLTKETLWEMFKIKDSFETEITLIGCLIAFTIIFMIYYIGLALFSCASSNESIKYIYFGLIGGSCITIFLTICSFQHQSSFERTELLTDLTCVDYPTSAAFLEFYRNFDSVSLYLNYLIYINIYLSLYRIGVFLILKN